jgi:cell division septation protein DedD
METNSPNGSGKSTWRERLGIGGKDLPKIAGEFSAKPGEAKAAPRPATARPSQPVTRPAPMAPRPAPGARSAAASGRPAIAPQTTSDSLAERLRAQRAAAEKLAEQRVATARERGGSINGAGRHAAEPKAQERPKFSFAEEREASPPSAAPAPAAAPPPNPSTAAAPPPPSRELPSPPRVSPSPIVPPRPALGGEPPRLDPMRKPGFSHYQPQFTQPGGYRPLDPPGYQYQPRPPMRPYTPPSSPYGGVAGDPRLAQPQPQPRGGYRRPVEEDDDAFDEAPRRQRGVNRARTLVPEDDLEEVFEDEAPPPKSRRRASAQDYGRAYREYEDEFGDTERRRSRGPFMVLTALVLLAGLIGGGIWYYNNYFKAKPATTAKGEDAPLVVAPSDPAKVDPPADTTTTGEAPAPAKAKQFYDRIVGEQTIDGGQLVPTEEPPVAPAPGQSGSAEPLPAPAPAAATGEPAASDPVPAPGDQGTEALPLPLPPPGDTQGALAPPTGGSSVADASEKVIPTAAPTGEDATAPVPGEPAPIPAAPSATPPGQVDPVETATSSIIEEPAEPVKPAKKTKPKVAAKQKRRVKPVEQRTAALGNEPVVLVAPEAGATTEPPPAADDAAGTEARSGSFFGGKSKLKPTGKGAENALVQREGAVRTNFKSGTVSAPPAAASEPVQVATIAEDSPAPEPTAPAATGRYVVQLGSFRSEGEARAEAARLKSKTAALNGVGTSVVRATVFGSSRYRVMTSPLADRAAGERICEALVSVNEPNCSVKAQ